MESRSDHREAGQGHHARLCPMSRTPYCGPAGSRKLEADVAIAKQRALQLDMALRARERDVEKLGRTIEGLREELHDANAKWVWLWVFCSLCEKGRSSRHM